MNTPQADQDGNPSIGHARWGDGLVSETGIQAPRFKLGRTIQPELPMARYLVGRGVQGLSASATVGPGTTTQITSQVPRGKTWHVKQAFIDLRVSAPGVTSVTYTLAVVRGGTVIRQYYVLGVGAMVLDQAVRLPLALNDMVLEDESLLAQIALAGAASAIDSKVAFLASEYNAGIDKT